MSYNDNLLDDSESNVGFFCIRKSRVSATAPLNFDKGEPSDNKKYSYFTDDFSGDNIELTSQSNQYEQIQDVVKNIDLSEYQPECQ